MPLAPLIVGPLVFQVYACAIVRRTRDGYAPISGGGASGLLFIIAREG